jgi:5-carboxymethyl-2-hydroxymuconate isomerase
MPHLWLEVPATLNIDSPEQLLQALHAQMAASGLFSPDDIKGRVQRMAVSAQGSPAGEPRFIHLQVALMQGRSVEQQQQLARGLLDILVSHVGSLTGQEWQLSVELREMSRSGYAKHIT